MTALIRSAQPEDAPVIVLLITELAERTGEHSPISENYVNAYMAHPDNSILLAEEHGQVMGLISFSVRPNLYHAANSCLIEELIVTATARDRGLGSALINEVVRRAATLECAEVSVSTLEENERAIAFYNKHGFVDEAVLLEMHLES
jgi:ribosomal protein S18 acetylase RimI-like enzyme